MLSIISTGAISEVCVGIIDTRSIESLKSSIDNALTPSQVALTKQSTLLVNLSPLCPSVYKGSSATTCIVL